MTLVMAGSQVMPVVAAGSDDEPVVITSDAAEETEEKASEKEVIEMPAELFNIETAEDEAFSGDAGNGGGNGRALGGLAADENYTPSIVDENISYKEISEKLIDGAGFTAGAGAIDAGSVSINSISNNSVSANFPYAHTQSKQICSYFDENYPMVRDQNPYGTCWAHSTLAAAEFYLINHGMADKSIDTSELALSYWTSYQGTAGPAGDNGNTVNRAYAKSKNDNFLNSGGNSMTAAMTLFQQRGITAESDVPYSQAASVLESEKIDYSLERKNAYYVTEYQELDIKKNPRLVKEAVVENGGVSTGICWFEDAYNEAHNAYYIDENVSLNHFVTVVGWDDNFPKDYFVGGVYGDKPSKNGAWLIRNSWNDNNSKAEMYETDYLWVSYEDGSLQNAAIFKAVPADKYEYNNSYYYDTQVYSPYRMDKYSEVANVYKTSVCQSGEILSAVTFNVFDLKSTGTRYTIEVYKNIPDGGSPADGTKVNEATTEGTLYIDGTYTISLNKAVKLDYEENYAVSVKRDDGTSVSYAADFNWKGWNLVSDMKAFKGQSWYKNGSSWADNQSAGNYIIHAKTRNAGPYVKINPSSLRLKEAEEVTITAEAYDANDKKIDSAVFTWESSDDKVASVVNGVVKAGDFGTATISAKYNDLIGKCEVTVGTEGVVVKKVNYGTFMVDGAALPLTASVRYAEKINYKARKIKIDADLSAKVTESGLYDIARKLSATGNVTNDVIIFSFAAKKNVNANSGSYYYLKAKVAKKSVTTAMGITGKNLKQLKKAVSAFNKQAKKKANRIYFNITPINALEMLGNKTMIPVVNRNKYTGVFKSFSHFRARLEPDKQPPYSDELNYKQWTKISNKEFKKKKIGPTTYMFTPKNKNVVGSGFSIPFK